MDPITPTPKSSILPIVLSIFLCVSLAGVSLLAYQNMQLQRQIAILQSQPTPTPSVANPPLAETPTVDPTSSWKTYTNDKFKFSIKYPLDWRVLSQNIKNDNWTSATFFQAYSPGTILQEREPFIEMVFSVNALKPEVYSIDKQTISYSKDFGGEPSEIEAYKIGTFQGKAISVKGSVGNIDRRAVFIEKDNLIYHIDLLWKSGQQGFETTMDQILSTFKFTTVKCTGVCPQLMPPAPNFCTNGTIISGGANECGCQLGPTCESFTCPANGWANCMPMLSEEGKRACSVEAMAWYKANCPNFQGIAR